MTLDQAREEMRAVSASLSTLQPAFKRDWSVTVDPFDRMLVDDTLRQSIVVAFGAVVMVLLIASANIANLLLAKGVARREGDGRSRGARRDRGRLIAQVLTESLVLCLLGGLAGVGLAYLMIKAAVPLMRRRCRPRRRSGSTCACSGFRRRGGRRLARGRSAARAADVVGPAVAGAEPRRPRLIVSRRGAPRRLSSPKWRSRWC